MMTKQTLRQRYNKRHLNEVHRRLSLIDKNHQLFETLILEAVDMDQAVSLIKKLKAIDFNELTTLSAARDAAVKDVNAAIGGRKDQGLIRKLAGLFKSEKENPLVDALGFMAALNKLFIDMAKFLDAHSVKTDNADELSVQELITGVKPEDFEQGITNTTSPESKQALNDLQNFIISDLKPSGALAKLGKSYVNKYMKNDIKGLARDLMKANVGNIKQIAKNVTSNLQNASAVAQQAAGADVATKKTKTTSGTQQGDVTQPTSGTKSGTESAETSATGEGTPAGGKNSAKKAYDALLGAVKANQLEDQKLNPGLLKALITILHKQGHLK